MADPYIFDLVSTRSSWLAERQRLVAGNVANADTPGYRAVDVRAFEEVLSRRGEALAKTHEAHISSIPRGTDVQASARAGRGEIEHSGNTVSIEQEMLKSGEVARAQRLANAILKAFHGMNITVTRG